MTVSKTQKTRVKVICHCGCKTEFMAFPIYSSPSTRKQPECYTLVKGKKSTLFVPKYKRGHHPNKNKNKVAWNKGLTKEDTPILAKMGYQKGHKPYNDWSKINNRFKSDPEFKANWLANKQGQIAWNKDLTLKDYKNGMATGAKHGNWLGGHGGRRDTSEYKRFTRSILERDNFTCQECGDHNYSGRGSRCRLEVHHIIAIAENPDLMFTPSNCVTLCCLCHRKTDNYGTKLVHKLRNIKKGQ